MISNGDAPFTRSLMDLLSHAGPFETIEEASRAFEKIRREYNASPQPELGGLSPHALARLLDGDWISHGPLRLAQDFSAQEVASSTMLADARTLLEFVRDEGPVKETAARYLPPAVVAALLPQLRIQARPGSGREPEPLTRVQELEVPWLYDLRFLLSISGLLMRRKGLRITRLGRAILLPERTAELYALLFFTLFRRFDLRSLSRLGRHPGLQSTLAFSLYKLRSEARDWTSTKLLAKSCWLEAAREPLHEDPDPDRDLSYFDFDIRVLEPLTHFALLEARHPPGSPWYESAEYRCTPLYDRFLRFDFHDD